MSTKVFSQATVKSQYYGDDIARRTGYMLWLKKEQPEQYAQLLAQEAEQAAKHKAASDAALWRDIVAGRTDVFWFDDERDQQIREIVKAVDSLENKPTLDEIINAVVKHWLRGMIENIIVLAEQHPMLYLIYTTARTLALEV